jgi:HD-GYP domain-containing protein (c-di-GMP phosphodiesterase class II)
LIKEAFDFNHRYNTAQYCSFSFHAMHFIGLNHYQQYTTKNSQNSESEYYYHESLTNFENNLDDFFLEEHSRQVSQYCVDLGRALDFTQSELEEIEMAGLLHDIGKLSIPNSILNKPGVLTKEEWKIMKTHTTIGYDILKTIPEYKHLAIYARSHHERIDGKGYPDGLKGDNIPYIARIISVVDAYEAMTSDRPYRQSLSKQDAINELISHSGTQLDKEIVNVFVNKVLNQ